MSSRAHAHCLSPLQQPAAKRSRSSPPAAAANPCDDDYDMGNAAAAAGGNGYDEEEDEEDAEIDGSPSPAPAKPTARRPSRSDTAKRGAKKATPAPEKAPASSGKGKQSAAAGAKAAAPKKSAAAPKPRAPASKGGAKAAPRAPLKLLPSAQTEARSAQAPPPVSRCGCAWLPAASSTTSLRLRRQQRRPHPPLLRSSRPQLQAEEITYSNKDMKLWGPSTDSCAPPPPSRPDRRLSCTPSAAPARTQAPAASARGPPAPTRVDPAHTARFAHALRCSPRCGG